MLTLDQLLNRRFRFERGDGSLINPGIRLGEGGRIEGSHHPNESRWEFQSENGEPRLSFHASDGRLSTQFDRVSIDADGVLELEGSFLLSGVAIVHRLVSFAPPGPKLRLRSRIPQGDIKAAKSTAVLVRSHLCDEKFLALMQKLDANRSEYDLYALIDETDGRRDSGPWPVVRHSIKGLAQMGLTQRSHALLHRCGDMPLYVAMQELPPYRHYLMLEDDVELRSHDATVMNELCHALAAHADLDFAGAFFAPDPMRIWGPTTADVYGAEYAHLARFPMVAVSRRLCALLFAQRLLEARHDPEPADVMHCEVFVATAAMAAGFSCADFNDIAPGSYDQTMMMFESPGFGLPMGAGFYGRNAMRFYHPVYSEASWVRRTLSLLRQPNARAEQVLFNLAQRLWQARAREDEAMLAAIQRLRLELPPEMADLLSSDVRHVRLGAPATGESATWGEAEISQRGAMRRLRADTAQWSRPLAGAGAKLYVYVPVERDHISDPEGVWALEVDGEVAPLRWNWIDAQLYAVVESPPGAVHTFRLVKISAKHAAATLAVLCGDDDE